MIEMFVMSSEITEHEKLALTPESGFNLVGIDPFEVTGSKLYFVAHFDMYQDALKAKKERNNPDEYLIIYKGSQ
jgi:hypothetical protein